MLSCDSRFPHLRPEDQLEQGNHFLLLFECEPSEAREAALDDGAPADAAEAVFLAAAGRRAARARAVVARRGLDVDNRIVVGAGDLRPRRLEGLVRFAAPALVVLAAKRGKWFRNKEV